MINYSWGLSLRRWLRRPEIFTILDQLNDSDAQFDTWDAGGCRLLACSLHEVIKEQPLLGTCSLETLASNECPADHVVLKVITPANGTWYLDARGATRKTTLLRRFAKEETRIGVKLVSYNDKLLDKYEIQCPPLKFARLVNELKKFITPASDNDCKCTFKPLAKCSTSRAT